VIASRDLSDLHPIVKVKCEAHLAACKQAGIDLLITCTYRDNEMQDHLYAQGRTIQGSIVTNAKGGQSAHNYRLAYDVVPVRCGKPVWGTSLSTDKALWDRVGELGEAQGLEWAGRWKTFKEMPHFQFLNGHPMIYFQNGGVL